MPEVGRPVRLFALVRIPSDREIGIRRATL
jgi:hypothetical protein